MRWKLNFTIRSKIKLNIYTIFQIFFLKLILMNTIKLAFQWLPIGTKNKKFERKKALFFTLIDF